MRGSLAMTLEQAETEYRARRRRNRRTVARQVEMPWQLEPFRLMGEKLPDPSQPETELTVQAETLF